MTVSVREQILAAVKSTLETVSAPNLPGAVTVYRGRRAEIPDDRLPALNMVVQPAGAEQANSGVEEYRIRVSIEGVVKAPDDETLDRYLADLAAAVHVAMMADHTFGSLAIDTNLVADDQASASLDGIGPIGSLLSAYEIIFWTKPGDPYRLAP